MLNILNVTCGGISIDSLVPTLTSTAVTIIKIFIPIVLIFYGMLDLGKAVMSNDEKTMKEAQNRIIKRFIYAVLVFLIVTLVQVVFGFVARADADSNQTGANNAMSCVSCFVNGPESSGCTTTVIQGNAG